MRHMAFPNTHPAGIVTLTTVYRLNEGSDWSRHPRQLTLTTRLPVGRSGRLLCGGYLQARTVVALLLGDSTFADAMTQYGYLLPTLGLKPFPIDSCKVGHQKQNPRTLCWGKARGVGQSRSLKGERLCDHTSPNKTFWGSSSQLPVATPTR